jgi:hypothetical protein
VLGSLNDLARLADARVQYKGGRAFCDPEALNHELNLTPMSRLNMASPLAETQRVLKCGELAAPAQRERSSRPKQWAGCMTRDEVRIERRGGEAILTPVDPDVFVTHFALGPQIDRMSDEVILACFNATILAQQQRAAELEYVAFEVPPGRPQIEYFAEGAQWVPRGRAVRCLLRDDELGQAVICVDDQKLSLEEFGRMLTTYAGWGMRIEFTPEDETEHRPRLEVRDPGERGLNCFRRIKRARKV